MACLAYQFPTSQSAPRSSRIIRKFQPAHCGGLRIRFQGCLPRVVRGRTFEQGKHEQNQALGPASMGHRCRAADDHIPVAVCREIMFIAAGITRSRQPEINASRQICYYLRWSGRFVQWHEWLQYETGQQTTRHSLDIIPNYVIRKFIRERNHLPDQPGISLSTLTATL
jgi:hypothetical protein